MSKILSLLLIAATPLSAFAAPALSRSDFNRLAARAGLPLFWTPVAYDTAALRPRDLAAAGDAAAAKALVGGFIEGPGSESVRMARIQERLRKYPKESCSYTALY